MKHHMLLIEDETDLGNVLKQYLELMDFSVDWLQCGRAALDAIISDNRGWQIVLVDVNLPEVDGFELAKAMVKIQPNVPFLFLTARGEKKDRLCGLKIGADDYIVKPFDIDELVLRMRNILKRNQPFNSIPACNAIPLGSMRFLKDSLKLVDANGKETILTPLESDLLLHFYLNSNMVIRREDILQKVWGTDDYFIGRSLDVFVSRFRKYFQGNDHICIRNIYGIGFMFCIT
ncbi:response regulator transcription factor [Chitinophaga arvensicola]|uniref:DNA-binding response regulator, OmpR family, contains REC and winged-helix (WHTH) domain n=1 Tax=Chitinophaga arvensicola TaxID=29529 RepID=A0A1I0SDT0_9BACT|nr:response regulator transcription factor [Chitinophaga arvensicola]SEW57224.1 DNA-binding response regulator, OmpR family, contains REC and winged-helix (wHTH) domain [Chitinophaga arvensicola]